LLDFGLGGIVTVEITSTDLIKFQMKNAIGGVLITLNSAVGELLNNLFITLLTKNLLVKPYICSKTIVKYVYYKCIDLLIQTLCFPKLLNVQSSI